jgi:uncharacterized iron-regulated membrane protein
MLSAKQVRLWYRIHKWTSLGCTAFLLMACITGLPLIFHDEIDHVLDHRVAASAVPNGTADANLETMVATTKARFPTLRPISIVWDEEEPRVAVFMSATLQLRPGKISSLVFDRHTGKLLEEYKPGRNATAFILCLHRELFIGLPGELLMGLMALLFVIALVSGALVYGPFMRRLRFGTIRRNAARRVRWFDLHNLIGIVTLSWAVVVGATGVINALSTPLFAAWSAQTMPAILAPYRGKQALKTMVSVDVAVTKAKQSLPGMKMISAVFPNPVIGSPRHYLVWMRGTTPATSELFTPAIIDAQSGQLTLAKGLPWYLRTLEVSRPLHFGDYGGMPLKIIWALFDVALITVLLSGVYLWLSRRKTPVEDELDRLVSLEELSTETPNTGMLAR